MRQRLNATTDNCSYYEMEGVQEKRKSKGRREMHESAGDRVDSFIKTEQ